MLPPGYRSLLVADTRRAMEWEEGLIRAGLDAVRVETEGPAAEKGGWEIGVRAGQETEARALVAAVVRGRARLPRRPLLPPGARRALVAVFLVAALAALLAALGGGR